MLAPLPQSGDGYRRSRRVLVLDDDPDTVAALTAILEHAGHRVRSARDGTSGIDLARTFLPEVLIVDLRLPDTDGFEVARAVNADPTLAGCYVIAVTGVQLTPSMKSFAVNEYFVKPAEPTALLAAVDRAN
jgi:DNA-binding response OmpR family regulator